MAASSFFEIMNILSFKTSLIGFASGALSLLSLVLLLYLGLLVFGLVYAVPAAIIEADVTESLPTDQTTSTLLLESARLGGRNLVQGVWGLRWAYIVVGLLGLFAGWAHQLGLTVRPLHAGRYSFICMALIIVVSALTWIFVQAENAAAYLAENPELYRTWRDFLVGVSVSDLGVGFIFAICAAYPIWASWRWWYHRLMARFGAKTLSPESAGQNRTARPQLSDALRGWLLKSMGIALLVTLILFGISSWYHSRVSLRLQHGVAILHSDQPAGTVNGPHHSVEIDLSPDVQRIRVVNINGAGTVDIYLSQTPDYEQADPAIEAWSFRWRDNEYLYDDVPIADLTLGTYYLHFVQTDGWGAFEYIASQGGGNLSNIVALLSGVFLASSLVLGLALLVIGPA